MPPAIIGGVIAGAGALGAAAIGSKATSKAAQATSQAADQSSAVIRENYDKSAQALAPWQQSGLAANSAINALLGLGGPPQQAQPNALAQFAGQPAYGATSGMPQESYSGPDGGMMTPEMMAHYGPYLSEFTSQSTGQVKWPELMAMMGQPPTQQPTATFGPATAPAAQPVGGQSPYQSAFDNYRNSTGYQFRLGEGMRAINSGYAGRGAIKSGAAMRAINDYGQGMASQEFGNYLGALGNQQGLGFNAARAQAGVGGETTNSLAQIAMSRGDNLANAALAGGQNNAALLNSLASTASGLFGQSGAARAGTIQPSFGSITNPALLRPFG